MVSAASLAGIIFSIIVSLGLPVGVGIYFGVHYKIKFVNVAIGGAVFIVFSMILDGILVFVLIDVVPATVAFFKNPWALGVFCGFAAGIFEECGRYLAFLFILKKRRDWKDGVAYGIGHGGTEAFIDGFLNNVSNLICAVIINMGLFDTLLLKPVSSSAVAVKMLTQLKETMISTAPDMFIISGIERIMAFIVQIALSLLILYGIKNGKHVFLLYAILIHAIADFLASLCQSSILSIWAVEGTVFVFAVICVLFIIKSKKLFGEPAEEEITVAV